MKQLLILLVACAVGLFPAIADTNPKYEFRGAWVATIYGIDWPSTTGTSKAVAAAQQKELAALVDALADAGFNAVMFQVRPMADALYRSSLEPWSSYVSGARGSAPKYDPLETAIALCHERGLECHAWINPYRVGKAEPTTPLDQQYRHLWMTNKVGRQTMTILNPCFEQTRQHICDVVCDIARRYDVDGIAFDDYFYNPEFIPEDKTAADWTHYVESGTDLSMGDWRRSNINAMIQLVASELSAIKNGKIRFGLSPQGIAGGNGVHADKGVPPTADYGVITADSQYGKIYSDPVEWLANGYIDYISPQIYWPTDNPKHPYGGLARWWSDVAEMFGRHSFPSIRISGFAQANTPESWGEAVRQLCANRESSFNGAPGVVVYSAAYISGPKCSGFGKLLADSLFSTHALLPPQPWKENAQPLELSNLHLNGDTLMWDPIDDARYVIYAIPNHIDPLDALSDSGEGLSSDYIIAVTYDNSYAIDPSTLLDHQIAIAPYDRYGNEWQPKFLTP
ncbi:MAG: family 10 glycosylhydrolase [Muribaculaceae bacterium]|nr:family 10 glycosylhydrolase [Muribaculaceae bacterium]